MNRSACGPVIRSILLKPRRALLAGDSGTPPRPLAGEGFGGELENSRSLLRAQRAIPACQPECARQERGTVMAFMIRGV